MSVVMIVSGPPRGKGDALRRETDRVKLQRFVEEVIPLKGIRVGRCVDHAIMGGTGGYSCVFYIDEKTVPVFKALCAFNGLEVR